MFEKIKKIAIQVVFLLVNASLVSGGVLYLKNQQEEKDAAQELANSKAQQNEVETIDPIAEKALQLQQIVEKISAQKIESVSQNTGKITVQQPKTVTQVIPGGTKTITTTSPSSSSSSTPAKTTKKS